MSHWWRYLPDNGTYYLVDSQETKAGRIADLQYKIAQIQKEMDADDEVIFRQALSSDWTIEEITQAMQDAKTYESVAAKRDHLTRKRLEI